MQVCPFCSDLAAAQPAESDEATEHLSNHDCWVVSENEKSWVEEAKAGHLSIERVLDKCKEETSVVPVWGKK